MAFGCLFRGDLETRGHLRAYLVAEARAVDHAWGDAVDVDAVRAGLEREALGDAAQAPLGGGIRHATGAPAHAEGAADVDDLAAAPRDHAGQHRAHGVEAALHVEIDDLIELLRRGLPAGLADRAGTPGHIDQHIDALAQCLGFFREVRAGRGVGDVAFDDDGLGAQLAHLCRHWFNGGEVTAGQGEPRAFLREGEADRRPHALGRAGDDDHLVL